MKTPTPEFYDPSQVGELYIERAGMVAEAAVAWRDAHGIAPAEEDTRRVAAFGIDCQVGFCTPGASLFVPGAVEDMTRTIEWLYANLGKITTLTFSLDTHHVFQVFHPAFWVNAQGQHPAPMSVISHDEVASGAWRPVDHRHAEAMVEYTRKLESEGRYMLTIWPFHTLLGGLSHSLVPALMEATVFHNVARRTQARFEVKGSHPLTENYSVLAPEVTQLAGQRVGRFNTNLFEALLEHDRVYVFGEAKSHCVLSTLRDMKERIAATDPSLADKVYVLADAMSPVPAPPLDPLPPSLDFPAIADAAIEEFRAFGFHIVTTDDPV